MNGRRSIAVTSNKRPTFLTSAFFLRGPIVRYQCRVSIGRLHARNLATSSPATLPSASRPVALALIALWSTRWPISLIGEPILLLPSLILRPLLLHHPSQRRQRIL